MSVLAIAESLDRMGLDIAEPVIERVRSEMMKPPSIAELYEVARQLRVEITKRKHPALSPAEFMAEMPDEVKAKVDAMHARWAEEEEDARDYTLEDHEWKRRKAAVLAGVRMHGVCDGAGKIAVFLDGNPVCPDCHMEVMPL